MLHLVTFPATSLGHLDIPRSILFLLEVPVVINWYGCLLLLPLLPTPLLLLHHDLLGASVRPVVLVDLLICCCVAEPGLRLLQGLLHRDDRDRLLYLLVLRRHLRPRS